MWIQRLKTGGAFRGKPVRKVQAGGQQAAHCNSFIHKGAVKARAKRTAKARASISGSTSLFGADARLRTTSSMASEPLSASYSRQSIRARTWSAPQG